MIKTYASRFWSILKSFQVTIVMLALLMCLVLLCTLAQVEMGTAGAVNAYMRSFIVWGDFSLVPFRVPVFPGGALVGLILACNLTAKTLDMKRTWAKAGLWLVHLGLIVLFAGEFVAGMMQVDTNLSIEVGQTVNYVSSSPVTLSVKKFFPNAELSNLPAGQTSLATAGVGSGVLVVERPTATTDNEVNQVSAFVEVLAGGRSLGVWLVSNALGAPQGFVHEGRAYTLSMRLLRQYLPYAFTLKQFRHDVYPGTDIPKNFSSLIQVVNPSRKESREVLIFMNQPLRYEGKTFYQASFGKNDTLSVLSVVENPGWLLPYVSCVLVSIGLLVHFAIVLRRSLKRRQEKLEG
ncbi:MAG: cytochrome c biogenesis protein ResB [Acidobacteria bacterium]|nr:cytochrome c biogenesis protein ResB [Acidobacteriota bacterium]